MKIGKFRVPIAVFIGVLLTAFIAISLAIRVGLPFHQIFSDIGVKFSSVDAYYWMRLVDNQVHNFPHLTAVDPFFIYPEVHRVGGALFFVWMQSFIVWVLGLGSPSQHTISAIAVYIPPVMAALTIIPVYFIGKALFNRWAGLMAAFLTAILPGEFLGRSILGANDTPTSEVLFTTTALALLFTGIRVASERGLTFDHILKRDWQVFRRPLILCLLAGLSLGIYLNAWSGGLLFVFIITVYLIAQSVIDHLRGKSCDYLGIVGVALFVPAMIVFLPLSPAKNISFALIVALIVPAVITLISRFFSQKELPRVVFPATLAVLGGIAIALVAVVDSATFHLLWNEFSFVFFPTGSTATTTMEMQHFLSPQGTFSTAIAWGNFTTSFFLLPNVPIPGFGAIAFIVLVWLIIKHKAEDRNWLLLLIWTLVILVATLSQRRFAYYFIINIALLSGYLGWQVVWLAGFKRYTAKRDVKEQAQPAVNVSKRRSRRARASRSFPMYVVNGCIAIIVVFFAIAFPNLLKSTSIASAAAFVPPDGWQESMLWMKDNTPEPLGSPNAYYDLYKPGYQDPVTAYGVTSWWDYGYWISRIAHRLPSTNPSQAAAPIDKVANLFTHSYNVTSQVILKELNTEYVVIDNEMPTSKFWAIVDWSGQSESKFAGLYLVSYQGRNVPVTLYYPAYYQTTLARLYNFDGKAVPNGTPLVVTWTVQSDAKGNNYRVITDAKPFSNYAQAVSYMASQSDTSHMVIASDSPFVSPIPLNAMTDFKEVHASPQETSVSNNLTMPVVKIFQYLKH